MEIHRGLWRAEATAAAAVAVEIPDTAVEEWATGCSVALEPGPYVNRAIGVGSTSTSTSTNGDPMAIDRFFSGLRALVLW